MLMSHKAMADVPWRIAVAHPGNGARGSSLGLLVRHELNMDRIMAITQPLLQIGSRRDIKS